MQPQQLAKPFVQTTLQAEQPSRPAKRESSFENLMALNDRRIQQFLGNPLFRLVTDLDDAMRRTRFLACIQQWANNFQDLIFTRQAHCIDPAYKSAFLSHFHGEVGHDQLLWKDMGIPAAEDPQLEALLTWFSYRMVVSDNAEKAALVHLVLEASADQFISVAAPFMQRHAPSGFFDHHAEADAGHTDMGVDLLKHQHPRVYGRLEVVVARGWDMLEAITSRIVELTGDR